MDISTFIFNYREAFGERIELPIAFWYSDTLEYPTEKVNGCFFKAMGKVRAGGGISLNADVIGCGGGKLYTGFADMNEFIPNFVSRKEKYKQTPQMVRDYVEQIGTSRTDKRYLHFARVDGLSSFERVEGMLFLVNPDVLSGLATWTFYDTNSPDAMVTPFGSGCSSIVTTTALENRQGGKRTFLGLFDPSVRPYFEKDILSFAIPMSRFREMYDTMRQSCLFGTHAWAKVKERIEESAPFL
ncbi:MAG: DUF169 domain-containing protein [Mediterranea sp.]|jgi:hypothetical protein|nr:DUF169 domain-containing protein [Mediterranea sp.]